MSSILSDGSDVVAVWNIPLHDKIYKIEFEHGTTTGKRVIRIDGEEILRRDWMFKLVGKEPFQVGKLKCCIAVEALGTFAYEYSLEVNGKTYDKFQEHQSRVIQAWTPIIDGENTRICLEKDTMDVWVNGEKLDTAGEFVEDGTETHFEVGKHVCFIKATSSGSKKSGIIHRLHIDGAEIEPATS